MIPEALGILDVYVVNVDGTNEQRVTNTPNLLEYVGGWTPEGYLLGSVFDYTYRDSLGRAAENGRLVALDLDGASQWTTFTRIVLPLSAPAVAVTALFAFMTAWNEYILARTFMNDHLSSTLPVTLAAYVGEHDVQWGLFAASSILVSLPVVALFYALQRYLVEGLTAGSVKG